MTAQATFTCGYEYRPWGTFYIRCGKRVTVPLWVGYYYDHPEGWEIALPDFDGTAHVRCPGHAGR